MSQAEFMTWFKEWKDVVTAAVAILAIFVVVYQINQAGRFERKRLWRDQAAARATLPLTLNALSEYGHDMIDALLPLERWLEDGQEGTPPTFADPLLLPEIVAAVEKVIRAYPDDDVAPALSALLGEVQVLQARSRDYSAKPDSIRAWSVAMKDNIVMAASVVARCQDLFVFARRGSGSAEPRRSHIQQVLVFAKVSQHGFPRVWKSVERYPDDPRPTWRQRRALKRLPGIFTK